MLKSALSLSAITAAVLLAAAPASAGVLVLDAGWQDDTLTSAGNPTAGSPWSFTISGSAILSVVDCCATGDIYTLSGSVNGVTSFYAGGAGDVQNSGSYGYFWTSSDFSKIALTVGPGSYSFSITGQGEGGIPAGLGVRLDSTAAVPEPMTWALMIGGFAMTGAAMRRRRTAVSFA